MDDLIESSGVSKKYTSTGRHSGFKVNLYHSGLDEHKHLSAVERSALQGKMHNQLTSWEAKWGKELARQSHLGKAEKAITLTEKAHAKLQQVEDILKHTLSVNDAIDWSTLKSNDAFSLKQDNSIYVFDTIVLRIKNKTILVFQRLYQVAFLPFFFSWLRTTVQWG